MKTVIIMGSTSDEPHAKKITDKLDEYGISWEQHAASAHKEPLKVLEILKKLMAKLFILANLILKFIMSRLKLKRIALLQLVII